MRSKDDRRENNLFPRARIAEQNAAPNALSFRVSTSFVSEPSFAPLSFSGSGLGVGVLIRSSKRMKKLITIFSLIILAFSISHADSIPTLEAHAVLNKDTPKGPLLGVVLIVINTTDRDITVLTKIKNGIYYSDAESPKVQIGFNRTQKRFGHSIVPSIASFEPVTIRPGEATEISSEISSKYLESLEDGDDIIVKYVVSDEWAERFDLWNQKNETVATVKAW